MPERLFKLLADLRDPQNGCPWDKKQTPLSLCAGILDEAFELVDAIENQSALQVAEELGDLLFQLMFVIHLYTEQHEFTFDDVIKGVEAKMIRRHPHVFGQESLATTAQVLRRWEQIKLAEKKDVHPLDSVPLALPALAQAQRLWSKAGRLGWLPEVDSQAQEDELRVLFSRTLAEKQAQDFAGLLFKLVIWGAGHNLNAEEMLRAANQAFREKIKQQTPYV